MLAKKRDYQILALFLLIVTLLCRGRMFLGDSIGIDTEVMLALKDYFYDSWLGIGRFGLVLLKKLTDTTTYNPYLTGIAVIVLLPCICLLWIRLFERVTDVDNRIGAVLYSLTLIASTILTEQLYFKLQAFEVCIGFCLIPIALYLLYEAATAPLSRRRRIVYIVGVMALLIITFSIYQVMVALFLFGAASILYLESYFGKRNSRRLTLMYGGVFLGAFLLNQVLVALFFSHGESYLSEQVAWTTQDVGTCVADILNHVREVALGSQIYYAKTFSVYALCLIGMTVYLTVRGKKSVYGVISMLLVLASPFYMTLLCGQTPVIRSQLVYPFALSFLAYVCFLLSDRNKWYYYLLLATGVFTVFLQVKYTSMLNYSDSVRYEQDVATGERLIEEIDSLQTDEDTYPVVCYGSYPARLNNSCIRGEVIGYSFFEWDADEEPVGFWGTRRVLSFLHALGANYQQADEETTEELRSVTDEMPDWPGEGSVALYDGVIVVKLGD